MPNIADGDDADRARFIDQMSTQISHVLVDPGQVWSQYKVASQPSWVAVHADGSIETHVGAIGPERLKDWAVELAAS